MSAISLNYYSFRIKKIRQEVYVDLDSALDGMSFKNFFKKFSSLFETELKVNEIRKKTFEFQANSLHFDREDRIISGIIESGDYGTVRNIANVTTRKRRGKLNKDDSLTTPFYFFLYFPTNSTVGFLCLQRTGNKGISEFFFDYFRTFFRNHTDDQYILEIADLVAKDVILKMLEGSEVSQISLRRYNIPREKSSKYRMGVIHPDKGIDAELILKAKGFWDVRNRIMKYIENQDTIFLDIPEVKELGFDEDTDTVISLNRNGKERSFVLNKLKVKHRHRVNDDLAFDDEGHPVFDSIHDLALDILGDFYFER